MPKANLPFWYKPLVALTVILVTVLCAWWQMRLDRKELMTRGTISGNEVSLFDALLLIAALVCVMMGISMIKDTRQGGAQPDMALLFSVLSLGCQAVLIPRARRSHKVELTVGLVFGAILSICLFVGAIGRLSK